ncbi:hypothetical protein BYT27DRAFT_7209988 [Phlegmacium glaucopus]|nr:hypothetical protein BYT27DRAFT_7209988 [Phlegmacium glaucopus]
MRWDCCTDNGGVLADQCYVIPARIWREDHFPNIATPLIAGFVASATIAVTARLAKAFDMRSSSLSFKSRVLLSSNALENSIWRTRSSVQTPLLGSLKSFERALRVSFAMDVQLEDAQMEAVILHLRLLTITALSRNI